MTAVLFPQGVGMRSEDILKWWNRNESLLNVCIFLFFVKVQASMQIF